MNNAPITKKEAKTLALVLEPYEPTSESWSAREHDLNGTMVIILKDGTHYLPEEQAALVNPGQYTVVCHHPDTCPVHGLRTE